MERQIYRDFGGGCRGRHRDGAFLVLRAELGCRANGELHLKSWLKPCRLDGGGIGRARQPFLFGRRIERRGLIRRRWRGRWWRRLVSSDAKSIGPEGQTQWCWIFVWSAKSRHTARWSKVMQLKFHT